MSRKSYFRQSQLIAFSTVLYLKYWRFHFRKWNDMMEELVVMWSTHSDSGWHIEVYSAALNTWCALYMHCSFILGLVISIIWNPLHVIYPSCIIGRPHWYVLISSQWKAMMGSLEISEQLERTVSHGLYFSHWFHIYHHRRYSKHMGSLIGTFWKLNQHPSSVMIMITTYKMLNFHTRISRLHWVHWTLYCISISEDNS